ncbi:hypothetical protein C8R43DRAFT_1194964 [Mycena crocata]|nr:hypothetical protein C8R43DRAFT_1194964 [Mycena crocata]
MIPTLPISPYRFNSDGVVVDTTQPEAMVDETRPAAVVLNAEAAMLALDADAHEITKAVRAKEQDDKETKGSYGRHVVNFQTFWSTTSYAVGDTAAGLAPIPAFPVTVAKAIMFLQYESSRPQKKRKRKNTDYDEDEPGSSSVGVASLKQAISALENWRFNNQHRYKDIPDAQIGLRTDPRIKAFESAAAHKEPERVKMAHSLKAKGSSADPKSDAQVAQEEWVAETTQVQEEWASEWTRTALAVLLDRQMLEQNMKSISAVVVPPRIWSPHQSEVCQE